MNYGHFFWDIELSFASNVFIHRHSDAIKAFAGEVNAKNKSALNILNTLNPGDEDFVVKENA